MKCAFFGHRDAPLEIRDKLKKTIISLIEKRDVTEFYVGNNGNFDRMALSVLKELSGIYPQIGYYVIYAYLPEKGGEDYEHTIYPEGIETAPKRFAIDYRNRWIVGQGILLLLMSGGLLAERLSLLIWRRDKGGQLLICCKRIGIS